MEKNIQAVFAANPQSDKVYVTSDGQIFLNENLAKSHSIKIAGVRRKEKLEYKVFNRVPETLVDKDDDSEIPVDEDNSDAPVDKDDDSETPVDEDNDSETPVDEKKSKRNSRKFRKTKK